MRKRVDMKSLIFAVGVCLCFPLSAYARSEPGLLARQKLCLQGQKQFCQSARRAPTQQATTQPAEQNRSYGGVIVDTRMRSEGSRDSGRAGMSAAGPTQ
jgi:hypothetical protein